MNVQQAVARILKLENVEWVSCFPSNELIEEAAKLGIRTVMFRQERGAIMAADGYSRVNDRKKFGVVITQGGPGSENSMGGIAQAFGDNVPILYLAGGPTLSQYAVRPNFSPARTYQTVSVSGETIIDPSEVSSVMRRAFHALRNGRPGPVIVEIPDDVGSRETPDPTATYLSPKRALRSPSTGDVRDAVKLLLGARRPVIWSGMGVLLSDATEDLRELAELTGVPVYCTLPGKSSFDERHPLALGAGSAATTLQARRWLQESDVLFAVGSSMTRTGYGQPIPDGKTIIHSVESVEDINKDYSVAVGLPGDAKLTLRAMIQEIRAQTGADGPKGRAGVSAEIAAIRAEWLSEWTPLLNSDEVPINTYRVIGELERNLDKDNSIVTHDAGAPRDTIVPFYTATVPHSYIGWGKTTHLGYGIPLMIGAKLAKPEKFCLNFMGDLAFGHTGLELETAVRAGLPITTVVINNRTMGGYDEKMPVAMERYGVGNQSGDYAGVAKALGARSVRINDPKRIGPALKSAMRHNAEGRVAMIEIATRQETRFSTYPGLLTPA